MRGRSACDPAAKAAPAELSRPRLSVCRIIMTALTRTPIFYWGGARVAMGGIAQDGGGRLELREKDSVLLSRSLPGEGERKVARVTGLCAARSIGTRMPAQEGVK